MTTITYVDSDGTEHPVDAEPGATLMSVAVQNAVPGIDGDCGGSCACGTCHLYVTEELAREINDNERAMLSIADNVTPLSRLGCQIVVSAEMEGLVVHLPFGQH